MILITLPILIPLLTAATGVLCWRWRLVQRVLSVAGACALLGAAASLLRHVLLEGISVTQMGGWPAPYGITLVSDLFSGIMLVVAAVLGLLVVIYSLGSIDLPRESVGFHPLVHMLLLGVCGALLAGDLFNLYVWFEVMLMASFVLVVLGGERGQLEGAVKYVTLNLIASIFFLTAVGLLYGSVGTVNLAHLARLIPATERAAIPAAEMLLLIAFGIKAAVFPLFFWLPASYHTPPAAVSALFAGLLTKVGVYAIIRVFTLVFSLEGTATRDLLLGVAGLTMLSGVLGAIAQNEFRRILSFHIVSQIGYMILGLAILTPLALAATVYFIVHNIFAKSNLFLVSGIAYRLRGTYELKKLGGLYAIHPWLALCFFTSAMALAGMPPLSGFWGKFTLVWASLEASQYVLAAVALVVGVLTLYSMTKIWNEAFWTPAEDEDAPPPASNDMNGNLLQRVALFAPVFVLAAAVVAMGLAVDPLFRLADEAAGQLLDSSHYIEAVLGRE